MCLLNNKLNLLRVFILWWFMFFSKLRKHVQFSGNNQLMEYWNISLREMSCMTSFAKAIQRKIKKTFLNSPMNKRMNRYTGYGRDNTAIFLVSFKRKQKAFSVFSQQLATFILTNLNSMLGWILAAVSALSFIYSEMFNLRLLLFFPSFSCSFTLLLSCLFILLFSDPLYKWFLVVNSKGIQQFTCELFNSII